MEARSLASLNLLAGNPPQYPENPSEEKHEPLILYISRVPGTRDIILSPFKPQLKNVTAEDVASCLYYVHVEMPLSELPGLSMIRDEGIARSSEDSSRARTIPRKPVPGLTVSLAPEGSSESRPQRRPVSIRDDQMFHPSRERSASFSSNDESSFTVPTNQMSDSGLGLSDNSSELAHQLTPEPFVPIPKRKPLGPRLLGNLPPNSPEKKLPPRPQDRLVTDENAHGRGHMRSRANSAGDNRNSRSLSPKKRGEFLTPPFTLSLIRRDPSSGDQWNIGKISSHENDSFLTAYDRPSISPPTHTDPSHSQHPPIDIQIEASGYAKFRAMPSRRNVESSSIANARPSSIDFAGLHRNDGGMFFSRQVVMSYSKSWTSNLRTKFHHIEQAARKKAHGRHMSEASVGSVGSLDFAVGSPPSGHSDQHKMRPRGYTFMSPWDTKCEFRTGNGGRSLRCHHILHDGLAAVYNPLVAEAHSPRPAAVAVSELRFNLPGPELFHSSETNDDSKDRRLGHFGKLLKLAADHDPYEDDEDDDMVSPFDVNLGGEKAGGGNRGKRAKLGKLIIYHDGLKMLDLLVAANMGLWWGVWERSF